MSDQAKERALRNVYSPLLTLVGVDVGALVGVDVGVLSSGQG